MTNTAATSKVVRLRRAALVATLVAVGLVLPVLLAGLVAPPAQAASHTFTVTTTADIGDSNPDGVCDSCSLREAIQENNFNNNPESADRIEFAIPPSDPITDFQGCADNGICTILLPSALPAIEEPVVVDGYSQPGASENTLARGTNARPVVEIRALAGFPSNNDTGGLTVSASNSVVKGLVIDRFPAFMPGILVSSLAGGTATSGVRIEGNFVGTDPSGSLDEGNGGPGVSLTGASGSTVGGTTAASRNLISGNGLEGVFIRGMTHRSLGPASNNLVQGNLIGTQKDGITPLGNGADGVYITDSITAVSDSTHDANGNSVLSNSIFANGGIGIDLQENIDGDGPNANDAGDADAGPNRLQNKPAIGSAKTVSGKTTVKGTLNSRPNETYTVQFFSSPSGNQGRRFLSSRQVSTDGSGKGTFTFTPAKAIAVGQRVTATATRNNTGDTSEFSAARTVASS